MSTSSSRLSMGFSCIGHMYSHLFAPIFFICALTLEKDLALTHGQVVTLVVAGNVLFGVAAPLAGWLGDRWSFTGMLSLFFVGTGAGLVMTGLSSTPFQIALWLAVTGLFASIYHPVGIALLVRSAEKRGFALGINGIFGGIGPAVATLSAGLLIAAIDWWAAFVIPGVIILATGVVFHVLIVRGTVVECKIDRKPDPPASRRDRVRAFMVLTVTLLCTGFIYQATQSAMPKLFSERLMEITSGGVLGVSALVAGVYLFAGLLQVVAGMMADRYRLKTIYMVTFALQAPLLFLAAGLSGTALVVVALAMVSINVGALPAENSLLARYAPSKWRGLAFGMKFILAFGVSGFGVMMEGMIYDLTGGFNRLFMVLAAFAVVGIAAGFLLPTESERPSADQLVRESAN